MSIDRRIIALSLAGAVLAVGVVMQGVAVMEHFLGEPQVSAETASDESPQRLAARRAGDID